MPVGKTGDKLKDFNQIDWDSMTFSNNLVFLEVMKNKELCKHLIEHVLHIHIREILYLETDKSISVRIDSKRIRLDVYVKDDEIWRARVMTWEMDQKIMKKRYYQQGEKSGEMKGKKIGEKIGARTKALEIAKTLLKDGMPVEKIARITNLPVEEVAALV